MSISESETKMLLRGAFTAEEKRREKRERERVGKTLSKKDFYLNRGFLEDQGGQRNLEGRGVSELQELGIILGQISHQNIVFSLCYK